MTNNDILRRLRYTFNFSDVVLSDIFALGGTQVTKIQLDEWFSKDDEPTYKALKDVLFATFLNGLIIKNRGKKDGEQPVAETKLNNNIIFRKLKIALNFKDDDIIDVMRLVDFKISKHELSAFFRSPEQNQYRECHDQIFRNFLMGLQLKYRPN